MSGNYVEMMEFNGSMNGGILEFCLMRFRHLLHILSHYTQLSCSKHTHLSGSMHAYIVGLDVFTYFLYEPPSTAFLCVPSDTTMGPRCVQATNVLVRLCICPGWSELSMFS